MKLLYTHPNSLVVGNAQNLVEAVGIAVELRNQFAAGAVGEIAPISAWPELWVAEKDWARAQTALACLSKDPDESVWACERCGEINAASFDLCWRCCSNEVEVNE